MVDLKSALADVVGFLVSLGDAPSVALLDDLGLAHRADANVALLVGDLTVSETLDYARTLLELGQDRVAEELVAAALAVAVSPPLGAQGRWSTLPQA